MKSRENGSVTLIAVVLVAILAVAGAFVFINSSDDDESDQSNSTQQSQMAENASENESTDSDGDDDESSYEEINLEAVGGQTGEGVAIRSVGDTTFTHELYVQTTDPPAGTFYEGWLVGDSVESTGKLEKNSEGVWYLKFTTTDDLSNHDSVVITEETESLGLDGNPERHIFEGSF